ncbi:Porin [Bosea sp. 62]|uniref:porin n=1 Tax=unclassified Bosea (in: a-proteobacteria) TaxID=2653178 RepID=UPI001251103D|nr:MULTISPECIES: porin [unclassified Bosea (in: a-proteobacteria)]CAD5251586.1 Porin [Bosea sp. 7B]CAD5280317.1 Porin [Bosea sp. 21B]CAD5281426.1 Porin [Bosea sp. 46]VVT59443.1 Porin [Bosea sp. EC-HK365B]VXB29218.1 Porin [Bosea sp. 62]
MKSFVSALGMVTAAFAVATSAGAADLPSRKAAPVEYVRVCSAYGAGFFYIPGTDTCLRVGGRVRAEYTVGSRFGNSQDSYGTRARGRLNVDARTATAYGTLRTFFRYELTNSSNFYNGALDGNQGIIAPGTVRTSQTSTASNLDLAFIQFGPITAGRAQSFFDFYANDFGFSTIRTADSRLNLLAYTATFGSGFSATVSLEDRTTGTGSRDSFAVTTRTIAGARVRTEADGTATLQSLDFGRAVAIGGQDFPDIVASLRVDQGWGSAQLSGAFRQNRVGALTVTLPGQDPFVVGGTRGGDDYAWAIQGGVKINLPMLAAGDHLFLQAAYADGALGYIGYGGAAGTGRLTRITVADIGFDPVTGNVKNSTGWSVVAGLRHFWTPQLRSELYGSYSQLSLGHTARAAFYAPGEVVRALDPKEILVAGNLIWSPVSGLDIGVEVLYARTEYKARVVPTNDLGVRAGAGIKSDDAWAGRLRIQRDF